MVVEFVNMLTYRDNMTCRFWNAVDSIKWSLTECDFEFEKVEVCNMILTNMTQIITVKWLPQY
jgi:hypothetical protein